MDNIKRVLVISYAYPPQNVVGATRPSKFTKYLSQEGWQPYVLTRTIRINAPIDESKNLENTSNPILIYRCHDIESSGYDKKPLAYRLIWYLFNKFFAYPDMQVLWNFSALSRAISIIRQQNIDVVYCTTPPHSSFITAALAAKITGKPFVADLRDLWTLHEYFHLAHNHRPLTVFYENCLENWIMKSASMVVLNTPHAQNKMSEKYPSLAHKFVCINNGFDKEEFLNVPVKSFEKFTVLHAGSFYLDRNPLPFLTGLANVVEQDASMRHKIQVIFAGRNSRAYETQAKELGIDDMITYYDQLPKDQLFQYTLGAHMLLLFLGFNSQSDYVIPAKLYEYMAVRKPILAFVPPASQAQELIVGLGMGSCLCSDDPDTVARIIRKSWLNYENGISEESIDALAIKDYDYQRLTKRLGLLLDNVLLMKRST